MAGEDNDRDIPGGLREELSKIDDYEEDELDEDVLTADDVAGVVTYTLDWSVQSLLEKIGTSFDIDPSFQRRDAWSRRHKSRYIESLMLGLPVPQIVLAEDRTRKGRFIVLDGKQRLLTMKQFANPQESQKGLSLGKLEFLTQFNGKTYEKIKKVDDGEGWLEAFLSQPVRTIVVRNWGKSAVLYQIFVRLNQYSVPLSPQELRQALFPGDFTVWINKRSAESEQVRRARRLKAPDFRMRDAEMLLRSISFMDHLEEYSGNLREFLDEACEKGNADWAAKEAEYKDMATRCEQAIDHTFTIFGADAFYRYGSDEETSDYIRRFNVAVYDLMCALFSASTIEKAAVEDSSEQLRNAFEELCVSNQRFQDTLKTTTKTETATAIRILIYGEKVQEITGWDLPVLDRARTLLLASRKTSHQL